MARRQIGLQPDGIPLRRVQERGQACGILTSDHTQLEMLYIGGAVVLSFLLGS